MEATQVKNVVKLENKGEKLRQLVCDVFGKVPEISGSGDAVLAHVENSSLIFGLTPLGGLALSVENPYQSGNVVFTPIRNFRDILDALATEALVMRNEVLKKMASGNNTP